MGTASGGPRDLEHFGDPWRRSPSRMQCRQCGTDIADKALICYKCGAATTDPKVQPPSSVASRTRTRFMLTFVALLLLAGVALFLSRSSPSGTPQWVTW